MHTPTAEERRLLTVFFRVAAPQFRFYNRSTKALNAGSEEHSVYQKNLELYRTELKKKIDIERLIQFCQICAKEKRKVEWITQVVPEGKTEAIDPTFNLLDDSERYYHAALTVVQMPVAKLEFGAEQSIGDGAPVITRVESFTMSDLVDYFIKSFAIGDNDDRRRSFAGTFDYLLKSYKLDVILYAIDDAVADERSISNPLTLKDYITAVEEDLRFRKGRALDV